MGKRVTELLPALERGWIEPYGGAVRTQQPKTYERYSATVGRWFRGSASPLPQKDALVVSYEDTTERKRTLDELAYQAHLLFQVHEAVSGLDAGANILYWNRGAEEIFGYRADEVIGKNSTELLQTRIPGIELEKELGSLYTTGQWEGEAHYRRKDDVFIPIEVRSATLTDEKGEVMGIVAAIRDVSERKLTNEALKRSYMTCVDPTPSCSSSPTSQATTCVNRCA